MGLVFFFNLNVGLNFNSLNFKEFEIEQLYFKLLQTKW